MGRKRGNSGYVFPRLSLLAHTRAATQEEAQQCSQGSKVPAARAVPWPVASAQPVFAAGVCPFPELLRLQPWAAPLSVLVLQE